jgi:protein TonB
VGRRALVDSAVGQTARRVVMTQDAVDEPARARSRVAPSYPVVARRQGITGFVTFNIMIDELGQPRRIQILQSSPSGVFEAVAQEAIEQWSFEPALYAGEPVKSWVKQTIRFNLR